MIKKIWENSDGTWSHRLDKTTKWSNKEHCLSDYECVSDRRGSVSQIDLVVAFLAGVFFTITIDLLLTGATP